MAQLREASTLRDKGDAGGAAKKLAKLEDSELGPALGLARTRLLRADGEPDKAAHVAEASAAKIPAAELRAHLYAELAAIYLERNDLPSAARGAAGGLGRHARLRLRGAPARRSRPGLRDARQAGRGAGPLHADVAALPALGRRGDRVRARTGAREQERRARARSAGARRARRPAARRFPLRPRAAALRRGAGAAGDRRRVQARARAQPRRVPVHAAPLHRRGRRLRRARGCRSERPRASAPAGARAVALGRARRGGRVAREARGEAEPAGAPRARRSRCWR